MFKHLGTEYNIERGVRQRNRLYRTRNVGLERGIEIKRRDPHALLAKIKTGDAGALTDLKHGLRRKRHDRFDLIPIGRPALLRLIMSVAEIRAHIKHASNSFIPISEWTYCRGTPKRSVPGPACPRSIVTAPR